jgi:hypothetical protein
LLAITGAMANETAVQLARAVTGRSNVVTFAGTYPGRTVGAVRYAGKHAYREQFGIAADAPEIGDVLPMSVLRTAARLTHWVAENAKSTRAFLKRVDAVVPLAQPLQSLSIVELPRPQKGVRAAPAADLAQLLAPTADGHDLGLISEAGLPAVADPGAALVQAAHAAGICVAALPGPSSLLLALAASGLNGQSFAFVGYLPVDAAELAARIRVHLSNARTTRGSNSNPVHSRMCSRACCSENGSRNGRASVSEA